MRIASCVLFVGLTLSVVAADVPYATSGSEPAARAALWVQHLENFVAAHPELTEEQRSFITEGRALLEGGVLQALRSAEPREVESARAAMKGFEARASRSFSRELFAQAFVRLGRKQRQSTGIVQVPNLRPECFCNPMWDECSGGECYTGECLVMPEGCGPFGWGNCTGMC
ncbi:MAG TPA: bacteriocin fulvocin C-related protein [Thermoanaerobaculia bacterium]|nr:bacteriocin fulvocin C-related protein [Thermoanaerobaculia bacterium]